MVTLPLALVVGGLAMSPLLGARPFVIGLGDAGGVLGAALFTLGALVFLLAAMQAAFDPREVWERVTWAEEGASRVSGAEPMSEATS